MSGFSDEHDFGTAQKEKVGQNDDAPNTSFGDGTPVNPGGYPAQHEDVDRQASGAGVGEAFDALQDEAKGREFLHSVVELAVNGAHGGQFSHDSAVAVASIKSVRAMTP